MAYSTYPIPAPPYSSEGGIAATPLEPLDSTATFETRPRSASDVQQWFDGAHPLIVVEAEGAVAAFAASFTSAEEPATDDQPLVIPEEAVVVAGSRRITSGPGADWGIALYTPVIVKYRDSGTDTA